jgi:conjugal transfer pilus assembly protein TrbC
MKQILLGLTVLLGTIANACEQEIDLSGNNVMSQANGLMVFVSLTMPKHSLQQWNIQVTKAGGILVLRGLVNNSMKQTVKKIQEIIGTTEGGFAIDPAKFKQFDIKVVPTVVVIPEGLDSEPASFDSVAGDVGLERALENIILNGEHITTAKMWLKNLRSDL